MDGAFVFTVLSIILPLWGSLCPIAVVWRSLDYPVVMFVLRTTPRIRVFEVVVIFDGVNIHRDFLR
jgi:hypothetical protein